MKRPDWFARDVDPASMGRGAALWRPALAGVSLLWSAAARTHREVYARRILRPTRLGCHVISVGNLDVGGVAKTPTAAWLASGLRRRGQRVALASRGYGREGGERVEIVSDGTHVRSTVAESGDEPWLLAAHAPGVPVLVGPQRDLVGLRAMAAFGTQVLILDDGFQHHRLARDLDIVLVDASAGFGNGWVLPRGPLREPPSALARADALGVVDGALAEADEKPIARHAPGIRRFSVRRRPAWLRPLAGGPAAKPGVLAGQEVGLLSGIARPGAFRATVEALGARVVAEEHLPDHHRFRERDVLDLGKRASCWVTTEKDAIKILPRWTSDLDVQVLGIEVDVVEGEAFLDWIEDRLRAKPLGRDAALPAKGWGAPQ
ncbi:MAG: tetraacyldisaccharide 4'-kinase [Myxococcota bacterium]|nr:tetraacyldisaccharide 4'-kinase [Myxococcota bacterium]